MPIGAIRTFAIAILFLGLASAQLPDNAKAVGMTVSVASSLRVAMEEVTAAYELQHPQTKVTLNFGSSGALQQQIEQGAPVDVFLPASSRQLDALESQGLIIKETRRDLLVNEVVLIAPAGSTAPKDFAGLGASDFGLLALGDPASVAAGEYGREVLRSLGLWSAVEPRLVLAKDVRQVLTYVESGNAAAGLVYATDARASNKIRLVAKASPGSHAPIVYPVAAMRRSAHLPQAREFVAFLFTSTAQDIFRKHGFLPGPPPTSASEKAPDHPWDLSPLWISIQTSAAATVLTFLLGLYAAYQMSRYQGRGKGLLDGLFTLPLVLPPTVIGFFLLLLFGRNSPLGQLLQEVGLTIAFSWTATVIAATVVAFPMMYRTSLGALEQVPPAFLEAARTLGASEWRVFRSVMLPLAGPGILAGTVLAFARALGEFGATLMLAGNIPGRTQTMPVAIFFAAEGGEMNRALGWVMLIVALSLTIIAALSYWSRRQLTPVASKRAPLPEPDPEKPMAKYSVGGNPNRASRKELLFDVHRQAGDFSLRTAFQLSEGPMGLLGASGSGKSMTLRCLAGIETPQQGSIVLNGRVLFDNSERINIPPSERRIGVLFQDYALFPHMTVRQNIAFGLHGLPAAEQQARIDDSLQLVRMEGFEDRYPAELSGGQRQRCALARALATHPDALLLDEPFSALDPHLRRQLENQLREALSAYQGVVVFVTHDLAEAFRFCRDLVVLEAGKVIASGPRGQLFEQPGTTSAARLTGCKNIASAVQAEPGLIHVPAWGISLQVPGPVGKELTHVGIRAHHLRIAERATREGSDNTTNVFSAWLKEVSESPHEMTLYLQLRDIALGHDAMHLQMDVPKQLWTEIAARPQPWPIQLPPERLLLLSN